MEQRRKLSIVLCSLIFLFFTSCEKTDKVGEEIDQIKISFQTRIVDNKPEPYLLCQGGNFECVSPSIAFDYYKTSSALYLNFGASYGSPCTSSRTTYEAHVYVYLGYLPNGNYIFDIVNKDRILHAFLKVEDGKYTVTKSMGSTVTFNSDPVIYEF